MEGKKISFGFKLTKKAEKPVVVEEKEFIECLEENSIKVIGEEPIPEKAPLVIPLKPNTLITAERLQQIAQEVESAVQEPEQDVQPVIKTEPVIKDEPMEETLEQMAVRELLQDAKKEVKVEVPTLLVPLPAIPKLDGQKESTLDDYESVPIQDFGLAMLRGMGWTPGSEKRKYKEIPLRPKGLGLGADKMVKQNQKKPSGKNDEKELMIIKNAFVKITTGKLNGFFGKVVSLDEDNGRVMVELPAKKETVSLSEFMMQPVTKSEYDKSSRVINADKYEEYKQKDQAPQKSPKHSPNYERGNSSRSQDDRRQERKPREGSSNGRSPGDSRHRDSSSEDRTRRKKKEERKKYSSSDSLGSLSDSDKRNKVKKGSSSESDSSDSYRRHKKSKKHKKEMKRDIDKKRKGKKKRRDRDRSPNYKKHRK